MPSTSLLLPVFVQVFLTLAVLIMMGRARGQSLKQARTNKTPREMALGMNTWSDAAIKASNNFSNQFELPVLFYAAIAFALLLKQNDLWIVALAWAFALSRLVHSIIHLGSNRVKYRFPAYVFGAIPSLSAESIVVQSFEYF